MMKKRLLSFFLCLCMALTLLPTAAWAEEEITTISTVEELRAFRDSVNAGNSYQDKTVTLTADIDLGGSESDQWTPIGDGKSYSTSFSGTFEGGGHIITGLYINTTADYQGLFGAVSEYGTVKNLVVGGTVTGDSYTGGVVGRNRGKVTGCYNTATVSGKSIIGGVVGSGKATNCYNTGAVSGENKVGGVIGYCAQASRVQYCYNTGAVSATGSNAEVGGVVGDDDGYTVTCYYLDTSCHRGGGLSQKKTAAQFASGEVTWELQSEQSEQVWGQALSGAKDAYPVLTSDSAKRVYKVTFKATNDQWEEYAAAYTNPNGTVSLPADDPERDGCTFKNWSTAETGGTEFTASTPVTGDITVYAQFKSDYAQVISVDAGDKHIYANGNPITLREGTTPDKTLLYLDSDLTTPVVLIGPEGDTTDGYDLTSYSVYGGTRKSNMTGDAGITMEGGSVKNLYGGGFSDYDYTVYTLTGNASVTVNGGTVSGRVCGGGDGTGASGAPRNAVVTGRTTVTISGGTVGSVHGGGSFGAKVGQTEVNITGGTMSYVNGGSSDTCVIDGPITVTMTGGTVTGTLNAGQSLRDEDKQLPVSADVRITGGSVGYFEGSSSNTKYLSDRTTLTVGGSARIGNGKTGVFLRCPEGATVPFGSFTIEEDFTGSIQFQPGDAKYYPLPTGALAAYVENADMRNFSLVGDYARGLALKQEGANILLEVTHAHTWSEDWSHNTTHHWHRCVTPDCYLTEEETNRMGSYGRHSFEDGSIVCKTCGYEQHAIIGQPTEDAPAVTVNHPTGAGYQWHKVDDTVVTDGSATALGAYDAESKTWTARSIDYYDSYFQLSMKADESLLVIAQGEDGHHYFQLKSETERVSAYSPDADGVYRLTAPADGDYTLLYDGMDSTPDVSAVSRKLTAVTNQTAATLTAAQAGSYLCRIIWPDGTVLNSGVVTYTPPPHTHAWATAWSKNDTHHWHECTADGCGVTDNAQKDGYAAHAKTWVKTDAAQHWQTCAACGWTGEKTAHVYDNDQDAECNTCGYTRTVAPPTPTPPATGFSDSYYTLTAAAGEGGSISPQGKVTVQQGLRKTFTITPDEGWEIADVLVDGKSVGAVESYIFRQVTRRHTIEAVFRAAEQKDDREESPVPFTDVPQGAWYYDSVKDAYEAGLMDGTGDSLFSPETVTSRAMIAAILWRLEESPESKAALTYPDCEKDTWYSSGVAWASEAGVVKGYDTGDFGPDDPITREQLAVMLYRYAQTKGQGFVGSWMFRLDFADAAEVSPWASEAVHWCVMNRLLTGKQGGRLDPQGLASRAEVAAMLTRFHQ